MTTFCLVAVLAVSMAGRPGSAAEEPGPGTIPVTPGSPQGRLDLSIRAVGSGLETPVRSSDATGGSEIERIPPSLGTGSSRWPSRTSEVVPRVHVSVMPMCVPGVDEPPLPGRRVRAPRR